MQRRDGILAGKKIRDGELAAAVGSNDRNTVGSKILDGYLNIEQCRASCIRSLAVNRRRGGLCMK
jgi:hypothetical protein